MFADPFSAVMALILLAFVGTLAVFFRIWRELDGLRRSIDDIRKNVQYYAVDAAQQNRDLAGLIRESRNPADQPGTGGDCLGELLEKGLPNLAPEFSAAPLSPHLAAPQVSAASPVSRGLPDLAPRNAEPLNEEEDFLRRFEDVSGKGGLS